MSLLTTKPARSMMYAVSIGGLLVCNGIMVMLIWNDLLSDVIEHQHHLTFLEGTGITAFAYVLVFAVKYGRATGVSQTRTRTRTPSAAQRCAEMTPEQRSALRNELVQSCGCSETQTKS
jgi:hypothetical protein